MKGSFYKTFCLLAILGFFALPGSANHILGGYMRLAYVTGNQYKLSLRLYRDCSPASTGFNKDPLQVGLFSKASHQVLDTLFLTTDSTSQLTYNDVPCKVPLNNFCVEARTYSVLLNLDPTSFPDNAAGYYFSWERGTRDGATLNIQDANNSGMAFILEFTHQALLNRNTSPEVTNDPYLLACNNIRFDGNWTITDKDDDVHSMVLTTPVIGNTNSLNTNCDDITCPPPVVLPGPYALATWASGYGVNTQIPGSPALTVVNNRATMLATQTGLYSIAFQITDIRSGKLLTSYNLELVFRVSNLCPFNQSPQLKMPLGADTTIKAGNDYCFNYAFEDPDQQQALSYRFWSNIPEAHLSHEVNSGNGFLNGKVCIINNCELSGKDTFRIKVAVGDNGCPKSDSARLDYKIKLENEQLDIRSLPNVFTPNGDGINDLYFLKGVSPACISQFQFTVYNRWGQVVYLTNEPDFEWDGGNFPAGAYYYVIQLNGNFSNGTITIVRQ